MVKTEDIPNLEDSKFSPKVSSSFYALNLTKYVHTQCVSMVLCLCCVVCVVLLCV